MTDPLEVARSELDLSFADLWLRYFAIGGMSSELEVEAIMFGALTATVYDRDLIAAALNERFSELGGDHPIGYSDDPAPQEPEGRP